MKRGADMRAAYLTLGCKVNQYDTNAMQELMEAAGYEVCTTVGSYKNIKITTPEDVSAAEGFSCETGD